jgi:hypothetical protein
MVEFGSMKTVFLEKSLCMKSSYWGDHATHGRAAIDVARRRRLAALGEVAEVTKMPF